MPDSTARRADPFDLAELADVEGADAEVDDGLDLEAYLDLEESAEIRELMQQVRGEEVGTRKPEGPPDRPPAPVTPSASPAPSPPSEDRPPHPASARPDVAAVARALGEVRLQARQLLVACPRCEGRASIVISGDRFKCFGCEATGDEAALARLLTGWDERRVAAWLAGAGQMADLDATAVRRPWRLSLFAR